MKTLVTGANGLVGAWILHRLHSSGLDVAGLARNSSDLRRLRDLAAAGAADLEATLRHGDLRAPESLAGVLSDVSCIVHCAARSQDWGRRREFVDDNVRGLSNLLRAAASGGRLEHLVLISTTNVESSVARVRRLPYSSTKAAAEDLADGFCRTHGIRLTVLRPSAVYGPLDYKWSYRMLGLIEAGRWPLVDQGAAVITPLFVDNLVQAVEKALACAGGCFTLTDGVAVSWLQLSRHAAWALGTELKERSLPSGPALALAAVVERCWAVALPRREPPVTTYRVRCASEDSRYSSSRASAAFGYQPDGDLAAHWKRTVDWYRRRTDGKGARP
jgi:nucleoside-diphosphate-sugar epimerase